MAPTRGSIRNKEGRQEERLDQVRDHGAVLEEPVDGVAHAVLGVKAKRQRLQPLVKLQTELLVDLLADPDVVVREAAHRGQDHQEQDSQEDRRKAIEGLHAQLLGQCVYMGREQRVEPQNPRLDLRQGLARQDAVPEHAVAHHGQGQDQQQQDGGYARQGEQVPSDAADQRQAAQQDAEDQAEAQPVVAAAGAQALELRDRVPIGGGHRPPRAAARKKKGSSPSTARPHRTRRVCPPAGALSSRAKAPAGPAVLIG
jgi:hypothetical protein